MSTGPAADGKLERFLGEQGWSRADVVRSLGSANRHEVFLLQRGERKAALKIHEPATLGRRDSFAHESLMHSFYAQHTSRFVPAMTARDEGCRALLFEHVEGSVVDAAAIDQEDVDRMAKFLIETNRTEILARARELGLPHASDSGSGALDHWRCAMSRLDALQELPGGDPETRQMQEFVQSEVRPSLACWTTSESKEVHACLSPSDFGFHNVLRRSDRSFCFLDFEHAGWDDPAKLAADFILQPDAPLDPELTGYFVDALASGELGGTDLRERVGETLTVQKAKWTAIILNIFERPAASREAKAVRLTKARKYWSRPLPGLHLRDCGEG